MYPTKTLKREFIPNEPGYVGDINPIVPLDTVAHNTEETPTRISTQQILSVLVQVVFIAGTQADYNTIYSFVAIILGLAPNQQTRIVTASLYSSLFFYNLVFLCLSAIFKKQSGGISRKILFLTCVYGIVMSCIGRAIWLVIQIRNGVQCAGLLAVFLVLIGSGANVRPAMERIFYANNNPAQRGFRLLKTISIIGPQTLVLLANVLFVTVRHPLVFTIVSIVLMHIALVLFFSMMFIRQKGSYVIKNIKIQNK